MRIDKYLKTARIIKRRTIAKEACEQGKVSINGKLAKAGDDVKIGDIVHIAFGSGAIDIEVLEIKDHVSKDMANEMYKNI
ncbi:MAG: RNA-binding S4 domain-containing protein [Gudongella sp.]|jgi:ribosomal 50S subunit-recycling heat shock protein|nr:RNA-binding S4 domain-containing protein [Gudongella sp.]